MIYLRYENKELLIYKIENSYIKSTSYDNGIEIIDYLDYIASDDELIAVVSIGHADGITSCYKKVMIIHYFLIFNNTGNTIGFLPVSSFIKALSSVVNSVFISV